METKRCTECGKEKPISEFSKSYKNRCKQCVAEQTKEQRRAKNAENRTQNEQKCVENAEKCSQFIKAVVKNTGETVMIKESPEPINARLPFYKAKDGRRFPMFALQFEKEIDWEQRRYEIAKEIYVNNSDVTPYNAVQQADKLIEELKNS